LRVTLPSSLPVAAGGVTNGHHLAGAIALGASGVWIGTLWLASRESDKEMVIKEKLLAANQDDTVWSNCISGFTMRTLNSTWHEEWAKPDAPRPAPAPYQLLLFAEIKQIAQDHGIDSFLTEASGQGVNFITEMKPARQMVLDMAEEALGVFDDLVGGLDFDE
jgi:NAD(P)H-dependent flavin oxidoreductase YrpB (nitropropane dioxygenase family)